MNTNQQRNFKQLVKKVSTYKPNQPPRKLTKQPNKAQLNQVFKFK